MNYQIIILIVLVSILVFSLILFIVRLFFSTKKPKTIEKSIKAGKYNVAIKQAKATISKDPKNSHARFLLGKAYLADKKPDLAFKEFKTLNRIAVFNNLATEIEFRDIIADLYIKFQHPDEALKEYIILSNKDPKNAKYYYKAGKLYEEKNMTDYALKYFEEATVHDSRYAEAYASKGLLLFKAKKVAEAENAIATALRLKPENSETLYCHGKILRGKKDYGKALQCLEKAARKQELRTKCFLERGSCYVETGNIDKAIFEFVRGIQLSKNNSATELLYSRYLLAECYEKQREIDKAIKEWEQIALANPEFRDVKHKLSEYDDLRINDHMKEYLTLINEEFMQMCRDITEQYFNCTVQAVKEIKIGCSVFGMEKGTEQWIGTRKKPNMLIFSRENHVITEAFLHTVQEQMKKQGVVSVHIITSSSFSKEAMSFAENRYFDLISRQKLQKILEKVKFKF